jgi:hypothetical protein
MRFLCGADACTCCSLVWGGGYASIDGFEGGRCSGGMNTPVNVRRGGLEFILVVGDSGCFGEDDVWCAVGCAGAARRVGSS